MLEITNRFEIPKVQSEAVNCEDRQTMQNTTQKSTDLATQFPLKTSVNSGAPEWWAFFPLLQKQAKRLF